MPTETTERRWRGICEVLRHTKEQGKVTVNISRPPEILLERLESEGCEWAQGKKPGTVTLTLPVETETLEIPEPQDTP